MNNKDSNLVTRFDDIYNLSDCREYYRAMHVAKYRNAHYSANAFKSAYDELARIRNLQFLNVLDFASGYGIGALLLRHDLSLDQVLDRYQGAEFDGMDSAEIIADDKNWLSKHQSQKRDCNIFAIDVADKALGYGVATGIFESAFPVDLQKNSPQGNLRDELGNCNLIIEVGSVAHMLPDTLEKILECSGDPLPWIITSPIRGNESEKSMEIMRDAGMQVEPMPIPPFHHRIFMDAAEQARAIDLVKARGFEVEGYESEGAYHAQLYLSRPRDECTPASDWVKS